VLQSDPSRAPGRLEPSDPPPAEGLDRVTRLLAHSLDVPISLLTLSAEGHQLLASQGGRGERLRSLDESPALRSMCELGASAAEPIAVTDTAGDLRLGPDSRLPADSRLAACAGVPLFLSEVCVGTLWAVEERVREWSGEDLALLGDLARVAESELALARTQLERERAQAEHQESEEHIRRAFDVAPVAMIVVSADPARPGRVLRANQACCDFLGRSQAEIVGMHVLDFTAPEDRQVTEQALESMLTGGQRVVRRLEKRYLHADGHIVWGELTSSVVNPLDGNPPYLISLMEDITERKQAERDLPAIAHVVRRILSGEDAREAIVQAAVDIAGASSAHLAERVGPDKLAVTASARLNLVGVEVSLDAPSATAQAFVRGEAMFLADPGVDPLVSRELLELSGARSLMWQPISSHEGVIGVLCVCWSERVSDVSARAARAVSLLTDETAVALAHHDALQRLAAQATSDGLTGLPNRRAWDERLARDLAAAGRARRPVTIALLDLDRFKDYNDTRGHAAGDELLRDFATHARLLLREGDTLARWGGEEFAVLLPDCPSDILLEHILERIREAVPAGQSCSAGYATWDGSETALQLEKRADRALYRAKAMGRNRTAAADPRPPAGAAAA
jgi:diguanylate cyclase (GGDEF)-like protein/PAS domain S-box-containing protein